MKSNLPENHPGQPLHRRIGTLLWRFQTQARTISAPATVVAGSVYFGTIDGTFYALSATSPQVFNGKVYVTATTLAPPSTASHVYVFNAKDGLPPGLLTPHSQAAIANDVLLAPPTLAGGVVFYGSRNGNVNALKADSLASLWSRNVGGVMAASPVAYQQMLFVGMSTGTISANAIIALNATNGQLIWQHGLPNYSGANIVVNGGVLLVGTSTGGIYALNADNGSQQWV